MERKDRIDASGAAAMIFITLLLALNQVSMKVTNQGFNPVFGVALRSALALPVLLLWMRWRGVSLRPGPGTWPAGLLVGTVFAAEFICLYVALDLTTVTRASLIFYTMPIWLNLAAHVLLPGERLTPRRSAGLLLAFAGVAWTMLDRETAVGEASLAGDLLALAAALGWGGILLIVRVSSLSREPPERQLMWQVAVSLPLLALAAPLFGPLLRAPGLLEIGTLVFQAVIVLNFTFIVWLMLVKRFPASSIASFSFLSPVGSVALGWGLLGEEVSFTILGALGLVAAGLILMNRPGGRPATPPLQAESRASAQTGR